MIDISAFGTGITIVSTASFPVGFEVTSFSDDEDPLTVEQCEVSGFEKLYDGSIFLFDKTSPVLLSIGVMANSDDDINMKILLQARKSTPSILPLPDTTTMIITYPDGGRVVLSNGQMISGPLADSLTASGRKKGNVYHFVFGSFEGAQSFKELAAGVARAALSLL
jgi:hypothetical protein